VLHIEIGDLPLPRPPRLLDQVRQVLRVRHYALRTEECYVQWIVRFIRFHNKRHPRDMGAAELTQFLTDLAVQGQVSASTQNQALNAIVFLYKQVLEIDLGRFDAIRANRPKRLPVVLAAEEVAAVLERIDGAAGVFRLMARLLYGSGLRLAECCRLRVKDLQLARGQIVVRAGKGNKDRVAPAFALPAHGAVGTASHLPGVGPACRGRSRASGGNGQGHSLPHLSAQFRDPFGRTRRRFTHHSGTARA
jgi:site-specific recombinase XerD